PSTFCRAGATAGGASRAPRYRKSQRRSRSRCRSRTPRLRILWDLPQPEVTEADGILSTRTPANPWHIDNENLQMERVLVVVPVEEAELLLPVGGIVSRIDVERELAGWVAAGDGVPGEPLAQHATEPADRVPRHLILQPRGRRLRA